MSLKSGKAKLALGSMALLVVGLALWSLWGTVRGGVPAATTRTAPQIAVSAEQLSADYRADAAAADARYKGRPLKVSGIVDGIDKNIVNNTYLTLRTPSMPMAVHAQLESSQAPRGAALARGDRVSLVCTGRGMTDGAPLVDECRFE